MNKKIILCSNSVTIQKVVEWSLSDLDYEIRPINTTDEVKKLLKFQVPDLLIIDRDMPGMGGIPLCKELKASKRYSFIPIILLVRKGTEGEQEAEKIDQNQCFAEKVLGMPFESSELVDIVGKLMASNLTGSFPMDESSLLDDDEECAEEEEAAMPESEESEEPFSTSDQPEMEEEERDEDVLIMDEEGEGEEEVEEEELQMERESDEVERFLSEDADLDESELDFGADTGIWTFNDQESGYKGVPKEIEQHLAAWLKGIAMEQMQKVIERIVPQLAKELVQNQIERMIDQETLLKIINQNRESASKLISDESRATVREIAEKIVPELAEKIIKEEIKRIKTGEV